MKTISIAMLAAAALAGGTALAAPHVPPAKLTMAQARTIALKLAPGKIADAEYENEAGGWRYSFDIREVNRIHEIGVDANTGKIVEDKYEALGSKD